MPNQEIVLDILEFCSRHRESITIEEVSKKRRIPRRKVLIVFDML